MVEREGSYWVGVDFAAPLVSPAYDAGATEAEVVKRWRDHHLTLAETRVHRSVG